MTFRPKGYLVSKCHRSAIYRDFDGNLRCSREGCGKIHERFECEVEQKGKRPAPAATKPRADIDG